LGSFRWSAVGLGSGQGCRVPSGMIAPRRFAPARSAPARFARAKFAPVRFVRVRSALRRSTPGSRVNPLTSTSVTIDHEYNRRSVASGEFGQRFERP